MLILLAVLGLQARGGSFGTGLVAELNAADRGPSEVVDASIYGAVGDAVRTSSCVTNGQTSFYVASTVSAADIGKLVQVMTRGASFDFTETITEVTSPHTVVVSNAPAFSFTNADCTIGRNNSPYLQAAIDSAAAARKVLFVPEGTYLCYPQTWADGANVPTAALRMPDADFTMMGDPSAQTVLLGNGAWKLHLGTVQRGFLIHFPCGVTNGTRTRLQDLVLDGGVSEGYLRISDASGFVPNGFPASVHTGWGWDLTHGAIIDSHVGTPARNVFNREYVRLKIQHWRGEAIKGVVGIDGHVIMEGCTGYDCNASFWNSPSSFSMLDCRVDSTRMGMEWYQAYALRSASVRRCVFTNLAAAIVINGAVTNNDLSGMIAVGNTFQNLSVAGFMLCPAKNITVASNLFDYVGAAIRMTSAGAQGNDTNRNILIQGNTILRTPWGITVLANTRDTQITGNTFGDGSTNVLAGLMTLMANVYLTNIVVENNVIYQGWKVHVFDYSGVGQLPLERNNVSTPQIVGVAPAPGRATSFGFDYTLGANAPNEFFYVSDRGHTNFADGSQIKYSMRNGDPYPALIYQSNNVVLGAPVRILRGGDGLTLTWGQGKWRETQFGPVN